MKISIWWTAAVLAVCSSGASAQSIERPWQNADGTIVFKKKTYPSWNAFHASPEFDPMLRCGAPDPSLQGPQQPGRPLFRGLNPADCDFSSTNVDPAYEPSVETYQIRVVVHVIANAAGTQGVISDEQVRSGIRILNEDFNAISGTPGSPGTFANIEFVLADTDPDGNPTDGITNSNNDSWFNDGGNYWDALNWDPTRYMNVYTTTAGGNLGYVSGFPSQAGFPGTAEDRVVVLWSSYGEDAPYGPPYNQGRTLTHEVGHYLGLFHTFQGGCDSGGCYTSSDLICDTNSESGPNFGCGPSSTCGNDDPTDNYMDYSDDVCMNKFTPEQVNRMRCSLLNYRTDIYEEGGSCSTGKAGFGSAKVQPDSVVTVVVEDCDLDTDESSNESVSVQVRSDFDDGFGIDLTEVGTDTGIFESTIQVTSTPSGDGLYAPNGAIIEVIYLDELDADGNPNVEVVGQAEVDGEIEGPPVYSVGGFTPSTATVQVTSTEPVRVDVDFGLDCLSLSGSATSSGFALESSVVLEGLEDATTYAFKLTITDEAGNSATYPAIGCDDFEVPEAPEAFAELFTGGFDLQNTSIRFITVGGVDFYSPCAEAASVFPVDPAGGTTLSLGDDEAVSVSLPFEFDFYGVSYSSVFVGSNGNITFVSGDGTYTETLADHFNQPRISGVFDDLDPSAGGSISYRSVGDDFAVTYQNVPEYNSSNSNSFQIVLRSIGEIELVYLGIDSGDSIVGLSDGFGVPDGFIPSDLSSSASGCVPTPPTASDVAAATQPGVSVEISLLGADDGVPSPLVYEIASLPSGGEFIDLSTGSEITSVPYTIDQVEGPHVRFTPSGSDDFETTFVYRCNDGGTSPEGGVSNDATVTIVVTSGPRVVKAWYMDSDPGWTLNEGGSGWAFGPPSGTGGDPSDAATGQNVVGFATGEYDNDLPEIHATTDAVDCSECTDTVLRFKRWLGVETSTYDHVYIRVSNDGGDSWSTIYENPSESFEDTSWQDVEYDISDLADGQSDVRIRWTMGTTDGSVTFCGWNIDDAEIVAIVPTAALPGDFNGDGAIDGADFGVLLTSWGPCIDCPADLNGNGVVEGGDVGIFLTLWSP